MNEYEITYNDGTKTRRFAESESEAISQLGNGTCWSGIDLIRPLTVVVVLDGRDEDIRECEFKDGWFTHVLNRDSRVVESCPRIKRFVYDGVWIIKRSDDKPFSFVHRDYDGPEDDRRGFGTSVADCIGWIENFWGVDA